MGSGSTPNYHIEYPVNSDATNVPGDFQTAMDEIDGLLSPIYTGTLSARPTSAVAGSFWLVSSADAINYGKLFLYTGSAWIALGAVNTSINTSVGSASLITASNPANSTAVQGSSSLAAAADHQHSMPSWGNDTDPRPLGATPQAGSSQRFADAQHVHPGGQIGDVTWSLAVSPPTNWLLANGQAVSTSTYSTLYALSTSQGWPQTTAGAGQFNIIDLRNRTAVGAGLSYSIGHSAGNATASLSVGNLPAHSHPVTDPSHFHQSPGGVQFVIGLKPGQNQQLIDTPLGSGNSGVTYTNYTQNALTGISIQNTGNGDPVSIVQPLVAMNAFIRAL